MDLNLRKWQKQFLNELKSPLGETFKTRKVIWVQDPFGGGWKINFFKMVEHKSA